MKYKFRKVLLLAIMVLAGLSTVAHAHESRVVGGKYLFIVGFHEEPAFSGEMNGVDLRIQGKGRKGKPVESLEDDLAVTVYYQERESPSLNLRFQPKYKEPGRYIGYFRPNRPGTYIFHVTGTVDGLQVNEWFTSGPGRFSDVLDVEPLVFPR